MGILDFVHDKNVIHRDIKPENIIRRKLDQRLVLVDFGAAKVLQQVQRTVTGTIIGSEEYCAPEQAMGKAKFASDLYSLGVTCLHLLTRMSPFDLYDSNEMEWVWRDCLNGHSVSDELGQILDHLIQQAPNKRARSAQDVLQRLQPVRAAARPSQTPKTTPSAPEPQKQSPVRTTAPARPAPQKHPNQLPLQSQPSQVPARYQRLAELLKAGDWLGADLETAKQMLAVMNRTEDGWLRVEDVDNFPCEDLRAIDQLWVHYSQGRFGFSVQKRIYQSLGGKRKYDRDVWNAFGDAVGWREKGTGMYYKELNFNTS